MEENKQPLNIEQAGNYIKSKEKDMKAGIKKDIEKAQISIAPEQDRVAYLMSALRLFTTVSPQVERAFLTMTGTISSSLSRRDIAALLKRILILRVAGFTICSIAQSIKEPMELTASLEELGKIAVREELERHKITGLTLFGNN